MMRVKEMIANLTSFDCVANSPFHYQKKCKDSGMENFKKILRVKFENENYKGVRQNQVECSLSNKSYASCCSVRDLIRQNL